MIDLDERQTRPAARHAIDALLETCGDGGAEVVAGLIDAFLAEGPWLVARVGSGLRGGDTADARLAAHTLKSHGMTFGAPLLAHVAAEIEHMLRADNAAAAGGLVNELRVEFDRARAALRELRDEPAHRR